MPTRRSCRSWLLLALLLLSAGGQAAPEYVIKFATLAPAGSTWMNLLQDWDRELRSKSGGRIGFKFYPGGVQGDEPEVLKKMRFDQLQGGAFTGYGIGRMYSPARVMELPFLFRDTGEIDFVRAQFDKTFREGFTANGYHLLGWMEVGFVHMFSREPLHSIEEMKSHRVWLWQGDPLGQAFFDASGISPVPLSIVDVYTSLSTGLIDTVYAPPLGAIALQWFTKTPYVSSVPLTNGMGALIVSKAFYDRLPADLQALLDDTGRSTGEKLIAASRIDNRKSIDTLRKHGLQFVEPGADMSEQALLALRDRAAAELVKSDYIPATVYDRVRSLLQQYRSAHADTAAPVQQ
jgi:TRAP-type C4-dicarboxylate transport system substrate-binding protein